MDENKKKKPWYDRVADKIVTIFGWSFVAAPALLFAGMISLYIERSMARLEAGMAAPTTVGFDLATVSALLGGLILTSAFLGQDKLRSSYQLRRTGLLYLIATLLFIVLGISMQLQIWDAYSAALGIMIATTALGTISFSWATVLLVWQVPELWRK